MWCGAESAAADTAAASTRGQSRTASRCRTGARDCRSYFSVRTGTAIARSNVPLRKWALAIYLCLTSLKSVSSMKLHRDIGVSQKTAWFMLHRIREAWQVETGGVFAGPVEVDETFIGGKAHNMHASRRAQLTGLRLDRQGSRRGHQGPSDAARAGRRGSQYRRSDSAGLRGRPHRQRGHSLHRRAWVVPWPRQP